MADYIVRKRPNYVLAVTKGTDCVFTMIRRDPDTGDEMDWDASVYVDVDIDKTAPTRVETTVSGASAVVRIESTIADLTKTGTTWRAIVSQAGTPTLETPILVGTFERDDGRPTR